MSPDHIGWVGTVFFVVGSVTIAYKWRSAFVWMLGGNIAFAAMGFMLGTPSLAAVSTFMGLLDIFGWFKWAPKNNETETGY